MTQVTPHMEELAEAIRQIEAPLAIPDDAFPVVVDREATRDIEDDYLDPSFIEELREGGTRTPRYRTYLRWRRTMVSRLTVKKFTQQEIADRLGVSVATVASDVRTLRSMYDGIATRDWALLVEERIMQLDTDIVALRRMFENLPSLAVETDEGTIMVGPDIDQRLRVYDRIMSLEARRDKLLGIDQAASRQHVEAKRMDVTVHFDKPAEFATNPEPLAIDVEIEE